MVVRMATTLITTMSSISVKPRAARRARVLQFDSFMGFPCGRSIGHALAPVGLAALVEIRAHAQHLDAGEAGDAAASRTSAAGTAAAGCGWKQEGGVRSDAALPQILAALVRGQGAVLVAINGRRTGEHGHDVDPVGAGTEAGTGIRRRGGVRPGVGEDHLIV